MKLNQSPPIHPDSVTHTVERRNRVVAELESLSTFSSSEHSFWRLLFHYFIAKHSTQDFLLPSLFNTVYLHNCLCCVI